MLVSKNTSLLQQADVGGGPSIGAPIHRIARRSGSANVPTALRAKREAIVRCVVIEGIVGGLDLTDALGAGDEVVRFYRASSGQGVT